MQNQIIQFSPAMPIIKTMELSWNCFNDELTAKIIFKLMVQILNPVKSADRIICNSSNWLESGTFASFPDFIPIGPLLASYRHGKSAGNFWKEDSGYMEFSLLKVNCSFFIKCMKVARFSYNN